MVVHVQPVQYYRYTPSIINLHRTDISPTDINFPFLPLSRNRHQNPLRTLILTRQCLQSKRFENYKPKSVPESGLSCACAGITRVMILFREIINIYDITAPLPLPRIGGTPRLRIYPLSRVSVCCRYFYGAGAKQLAHNSVTLLRWKLFSRSDRNYPATGITRLYLYHNALLMNNLK